jgi:hypothetical protein
MSIIEPRLVPSYISVVYSQNDKSNQNIFKNEFRKISEIDDDPVGSWLKMITAKGEARDTDKILTTLIVELHRKLNIISDKIDKKQKQLLTLKYSDNILSIGYQYFKIEDESFVVGESYYGRIDMPTFPQREVPIYFEAISKNLAKIFLMHDRDTNDWDSYVASRERIMIRETKKGGQDV